MGGGGEGGEEGRGAAGARLRPAFSSRTANQRGATRRWTAPRANGGVARAGGTPLTWRPGGGGGGGPAIPRRPGTAGAVSAGGARPTAPAPPHPHTEPRTSAPAVPPQGDTAGSVPRTCGVTGCHCGTAVGLGGISPHAPWSEAARCGVGGVMSSRPCGFQGVAGGWGHSLRRGVTRCCRGAGRGSDPPPRGAPIGPAGVLPSASGGDKMSLWGRGQCFCLGVNKVSLWDQPPCPKRDRVLLWD